MDYLDISEIPDRIEDVLHDESVNCEIAKKGRGPDIDWQELARYKSQKEFNEGSFNEELKVMSRRKVYMTEQAEVANYVCKYSKKAGYKVCNVQYKVCYLQTSMDILIFTNEQTHHHEEEKNYSTPVNFHWTLAQEEIIMKGIRDATSNKLILRNIIEAKESTNGKYPTLGQLEVNK